MSAWTLFPHLVVRTTGFPFELLERLQLERTYLAAQALVRARAAIDAHRAVSPRLHRPSKAVLAALKASRPVPLAQVENPALFAEWNRLTEALARAEQDFHASLAREGPAASAALRSLTEDPRFLEAVASSSPPVYDDLSRGRWSNRLERQVGSYVQRLTAKNETMSFFGPINYGHCDPDAETGVRIEWSGPLVLKGRRTHVASWLVQTLVQRVAFDREIAPWLVPARKGWADPPLPRFNLRLGEILLQSGNLSPSQLQQVLTRQLLERQKLGELLVGSQLLSKQALDDALGKQQALRGAAAEGLLERLVRAADGRRTLSVWVSELGTEPELLFDIFRSACEKRLLTHQLEVPPGISTPLQDLAERLAGIPGEAARAHVKGIREILKRMRHYGAAGAAEKVAMSRALTQFLHERWNIRAPMHEVAFNKKSRSSPEEEAGGAGGGGAAEARAAADKRRAEGHHFYADRLPLREECGGDLHITLAGERAREVNARVSHSLELLTDAAMRTRRAAQRHLAQILGKKSVPFWKVVVAYSDRPVPFDDTLSQWLASQPLEKDARHVSLDGLTPPPADATDGLPVLCSVDLLVCAKDAEAWARGEYRLVMGDIHDTALVWGWALQFHDRRADVEAEMICEMGALPRSIPVLSMMASRRTGLLPAEFPGPVIEVGGVSGRPASWKVSLDDLVVVSDGSGARLMSQSLRSEVCIYNGELDSLVHNAFSLPRIRPPKFDLGEHTPRVSYRDVVLQREQWRLGEADVKVLLECGSDRERLLVAAALWERLQLPRYVFAKFPNERKPILVDPASSVGLRVLTNLLQHRGGAVLSEMLPGPDELWLRHPEGRHTAELRCTFLRSNAG